MEPKRLANFETLARQKRFQLLGQACRYHKITSLMLAHHQDDQVETIMIRLISGHRGAGLSGIKIKSAIPECYGLYGIHESGGLVLPKSGGTIRNSLGISGSFTPEEINPIPETGGIQIYRPLLCFDKKRLIATCEASRMPWFEDKTNRDPTLTTRNAIRYLYDHHSMPAALSKSALISLATKIENRTKRETEIANRYLSMIHISLFDTSSGIVKVKFPQFSFAVERLKYSEDSMISQVATEVLRRVITLVTPEEHVRQASLRGTTNRIFTEIFRRRQASSSPVIRTKRAPDAFTICGVLFQSIDDKKPRVRSDNLPMLTHVTHKDCTWLISRQPCQKSTAHNFSIIISALPESRWVLFDGRYWIKIRNLCQSNDLIIRFFDGSDMKSLSSQLTAEARTNLRKKLSKVAPGKVRWTLPLIVLYEFEKKIYKPLSLPTLGINVPGAKEFGSWETRYKKVYTDHMKIIG